MCSVLLLFQALFLSVLFKLRKQSDEVVEMLLVHVEGLFPRCCVLMVLVCLVVFSVVRVRFSVHYSALRYVCLCYYAVFKAGQDTCYTTHFFR